MGLLLQAPYLRTLAVKCYVAPNPAGECCKEVGEGSIKPSALQGVGTSHVTFQHSRLVGEGGPSW